MKDVPHSQKQWKKKIEEWGSKLKFKRNYQCRDCRMLEKNDPMKYHLLYGKMFKKFRSDVRKVYRVYHKSDRQRGDIMTLQENINKLFNELPIQKYTNLDNVLHTTNKDGLIKLDGMTIQNYPLVGDHYIAFTKKRRKSH